MANIFTIGYSAFGIDEFIDELQKNSIVCVVDVRSNPVSGEYYKDYNGYNLEKILKQHDIHYRSYAREFGARQDDPAFFSDEGYVDFEKFTQSEQFKNGLAKVKAGFDKNYNCVLMCAEKDPINCHRSIMIAHALQKTGIEVLNILGNGKIERQSETEQRLLNIYFPNRKQQRLFEEIPAEEVLIEQAYKKQNEKIGYRLENI
ncbi:DUF488 domain-containing protein [bacterium]|nr:DUF488 domain-containing protein [bacterium]